MGAVRQVKTHGLTLLEEVVHYEPPFRYDYRITKGLPVDHLGSVRLAPTEDGVELSWEVRMSSRWPLACELLGYRLSFELVRARSGAWISPWGRNCQRNSEASAANRRRGYLKLIAGTAG